VIKKTWALVAAGLAIVIVGLFVFGPRHVALGLAPLGLVPLVGLVTAIDPTTKRPGIGLLVNLKTGTASNAGAEIRYLILSPKNATGGTGTATVDTVVYENLANADAVAALLGPGSLGHLLAKALFVEHPTAAVDLIALAAASGNTATGTITFDDATPVTVARVAEIEICGRLIDVDWFAGETDIEAATRAVSEINKLTRDLPIVASNAGGTAPAVTLTFKSKGLAGNDVIYKARLKDGGTGGDITPTTRTNATGGTTTPAVVNALALIVAREYRLIAPAISNTDAAAASATSTMGRIKTHISTYNNGIGALLQTAHSACTDTTTNAKAMANQHGFEFFSHHLARGALSLPCEWTGAIVGAYGREIRTDPNHNFIHTEFRATLYGTPDIDGDALTAAECEDMLTSGASYVSYNAQKEPRFERPITCYFEDTDGNPDDRVLDIGKPFGALAVAADLRVETQRVWKNKKLARELPQGSTPIPPNVVTEAAAKAFIIGRIRSRWCSAGVVSETALDTAIEDESIVIQVDDADETQLDTFLPLRIVPVFAKHSIVIVQA